jgi:site-specific DNA recombinase
VRAKARTQTQPRLRVYLRRSKADEGHQQFSLDVQRDGSRLFTIDELARLGISIPWSEREEYIDDDRAGDDFEGRPELRRLRADIQPNDIVLCRDQSRLGRDALEVTLAVRDIVKDRGARLFYYSERKEVEFANAIDAAMTFIKGTGHQMELEAIRGRVREALRARVRGGRITGGRCYGYDLRREKDGSGREYTIAVINEAEAEIVRRMFREYLAGAGLKRIAVRLNNEHIAPPRAGRRGTGSWCPGAIREMLRNARYRGIYTHGKTVRVRRGAKRVAMKAPIEDLITLEVPEWRIVEDTTWLDVQDLIGRRAADAEKLYRPGPRTRYALSGLARCAGCRGAIGSQTSRISDGSHMKVYGCSKHHMRGSAVCPITMRQSVEEVDASLAQYIGERWLKAEFVEEVIHEMRGLLESQVKATQQDAGAIETELARLRSEQRNLAAAVATGGDAIPELLSELRARNDRIRALEADLAAAKRTPAMLEELLSTAERNARQRVADLRVALANPSDAREVFESVFLPEGLEFKAGKSRDGSRRVWAISMTAHPVRSILSCDPTGT